MTERVSEFQTDYLIVGAGAGGMSFADVLLSKSEANMVIVDRRHAPGGHWNDAYAFARLHMPSGCYGVDSTPLGSYGIGVEGDTALYERASAAEICGYFDQVLHQRMRPGGRVRFLGSVDHLGGGRLRSRTSGRETIVTFSKLVDATFLEADIPATSQPPFEVSSGVQCIPVGELARIGEPPDEYVVVGAGKTGQDACLWLLASGVDPASIRWIRPRDPWLQTRRSAQPGPGVPEAMEIFSSSVEAAAQANSVTDLFRSLERANVLARIDLTVEPSTYQGAIISDYELNELRRIENVIRLGHVRRIGLQEIELDQGTVPTSPNTVHVHCAAHGTSAPPTVPVFDRDTITLQHVRYGLLPLSAAITAFVEATRTADEEKNTLCRPLESTGAAEDWLRQRLADLDNSRRWRDAPDLAEWLNGTRLNITGGLNELREDPTVRTAMKRFSANAKAAVMNLERLLAGSPS